MTVIRIGLLAGVAIFAASCAKKTPYRDASGQPISSPDQYGYMGQAAPAPNPAPGFLTSENLPWPKTFVSGNLTNVIYQPQIETWNGGAVTMRNAVAVQVAGQPQPIYGVIHSRATTSVDRTNGMVTLLDHQITEAEFPSAPERKEEFLRSIRSHYPDGVQMMTLVALENAVAANQQQEKALDQPLQNTPPKILVATQPMVLVNIDGAPAYGALEGTDYQRVLNTRVLLLKDRAGKHYLHLLDGYVMASTIEGPWSFAPRPTVAAIAESIARTNNLDLLEAPAAENPALTATNVPSIHIATTPTELLAFDGEPDYVPIPGTQLLYATNTTGNVFKSLADQQSYVLLSGRWFKGPGLQGPWEFVPSTSLPKDFAQIPDNSPKENVKASVPGTVQAREAMVVNSIPTSTGVRRGTMMNPPQIDGPPRLQPIGGTPLHYVENSGTPTIKVDDKSWYACQDGVWYVATSLEGPWVVADSVPAVIYSIPPSSPVHYVTYVRVYDSNPNVVYQGYTPGYMGTVVSSDAVVVYGTGYYYRPWVGHYWYSSPATWGMGWGPFWSPWTSWSYGYGFGWYTWGYHGHRRHHHHYYACRPVHPSWGPYRRWAPPALSPYRPAGVNTSGNVYRPPATTRPVVRNIPDAARPTAFASAYNSRTGRVVAGQHAQVENVFRVKPEALPSGPVRTTAATSGNYAGGPRTIRSVGAPPVVSRDRVTTQRAGGTDRMRANPQVGSPIRAGVPAPAPAVREAPQRIMRVEPTRVPERSAPASMPPGISQRRRN